MRILIIITALVLLAIPVHAQEAEQEKEPQRLVCHYGRNGLICNPARDPEGPTSRIRRLNPEEAERQRQQERRRNRPAWR